MAETKTDKIMQRTLVLIKPDGVQRSLVGQILQRFETAGLKIVGMKMKWMDKDFSKKHYVAHVAKPFYPGIETFMTSGPVVAFVLEGIHAVELVRKIVGSTEPKSALPGTIRGDYAQHSYDFADKNGISIKNIIHASGNLEDAEYEVKLWFTDEELHTYKTVHEIHVF